MPLHNAVLDTHSQVAEMLDDDALKDNELLDEGKQSIYPSGQPEMMK